MAMSKHPIKITNATIKMASTFANIKFLTASKQFTSTTVSKSTLTKILLNTKISKCHLTPEIKLHLITKDCHLWRARLQECPFTDPYWAFYWPGGQVITRFAKKLF